GAGLVAAFLAKHYGGNYQGPGVAMTDPAATVTTQDHHALVSGHMLNLKGTQRRARGLDAPATTVCAGGNHAGLVAALMAPYYGSGSGETGRDLRDPVPTVPCNDRFQLVTVDIEGETYVLADIGMRMLQPRELFRANGFPDEYRIDLEVDGRKFSKSDKTRLVGNSVPPQWAAVLSRANVAEVSYGVAAA
ncbi:MAG TPA: DNA cytosine methyltransferase, partial [Gammaproteobacteria bacterium]|nr:DNA cytosine methyltransferase [Gammaproteobacteria bacterium]